MTDFRPNIENWQQQHAVNLLSGKFSIVSIVFIPVFKGFKVFKEARTKKNLPAVNNWQTYLQNPLKR